jgi:hypothetical protein
VGLARKLWFRRNEVIHRGQFMHPNELVKRTISSIADYEAATKKDDVASAAVGDMVKEAWIAPRDGIFKINWDAGLNHKEGRIGLGYLVRDEGGRVIAAQCITKTGRLDAMTTAEALAAVFALRFCTEMGSNKICLEGNAKLVVRGCY